MTRPQGPVAFSAAGPCASSGLVYSGDVSRRSTPSADLPAAVLDAWTARLASEAEGLDLADAEDRAIFRGRVFSATAYTKHLTLCQISAALGGAPRHFDRAQAARAIADRWIARTAEAEAPVCDTALQPARGCAGFVRACDE